MPKTRDKLVQQQAAHIWFVIVLQPDLQELIKHNAAQLLALLFRQPHLAGGVQKVEQIRTDAWISPQLIIR
jgi:hypothetical protein